MLAWRMSHLGTAQAVPPYASDSLETREEWPPFFRCPSYTSWAVLRPRAVRGPVPSPDVS